MCSAGVEGSAAAGGAAGLAEARQQARRGQEPRLPGCGAALPAVQGGQGIGLSAGAFPAAAQGTCIPDMLTRTRARGTRFGRGEVTGQNGSLWDW